jgi:protein kinase X
VATQFKQCLIEQEVKEQRWFRMINWQDVMECKLVPPIIPEAKGEGDSSNYEQYEVPI